LQNSSAFTTGRACTPSSGIKGGYCLVLGTASIKSADAEDASCAQHLIGWPRYCLVSNKRRWLQAYAIDWQPKAANVSRWQLSCMHHTICAVFYTFAC